MRAFVLVIVATACAFIAHAQVVLTDDSKQEVVANIFHFRTTDTKLDVLKIPPADFKLLPGDISLGYDRDVHWFRFEVVNRSSNTEWFIELAAPVLDHVEFYYQDASGAWKLQYSGDVYKVSQRPVKHKNFVFPFSMSPDTKQTIYVKTVTTSAIQFPIFIWSPEGFRDDAYDVQFGHGLFYGVMLIMICYHFLLYLSIRDRTILYYVLTLIAGANVIAYFYGFGYFYLTPEFPEITPFMGAFASPFFIVASVALTRSFLALKQFSFWLDRLLLAIAVVAVLLAFLTVGLKDYISYMPIRLLSLTNFLTILVSGVYCLMKNYRPARYFLLAWGSILVMGVFLLLRNVGWVGESWLTENGLYFGGVMQVLLISFAFGDRFSAMEKENLAAKERELRREHEEKERLEREIYLRTEEIRQKNLLLEESNNIKNKLFSIVSHDLRGPLISLQGILDMVDMDTLSQEDLKKFTGKVGVRLHHTADFLDNLLQWSRMQMQGEKFVPNRDEFSLQQLLVSATLVLRAEAERKNIKLSVNSPTVDVYADMNMMQTVVRNLVSNALKFTHPGGHIELTAIPNGSMVAVNITDTGIGITEENIKKLFTLHGVTMPGTQLEKGTGIGLAVCKEFVERNGGTISVESKVGIGTTFKFTIPLPAKP